MTPHTVSRATCRQAPRAGCLDAAAASDRGRIGRQQGQSQQSKADRVSSGGMGPVHLLGSRAPLKRGDYEHVRARTLRNALFHCSGSACTAAFRILCSAKAAPALRQHATQGGARSLQKAAWLASC